MSRQLQPRNADPRLPPPGRRHWIEDGRRLGLAVSCIVHALVILAALLARATLPKPRESRTVTVELIDEPSPAAAPAPTASASPAPAPRAHAAAAAGPSPKPSPRPSRAPAKTPPPRPTSRPTRARADEDTPASDEVAAGQPGPEMSDAQLVGAASAGSGDGAGNGGACDMASRLQAVLRKDPLVHAAVAGMAGRALRVWDGNWVWMRGDTGQGLTAVRQAMEWEMAYAPQACRSKPMNGLVIFSLNEARGPDRLAVGLGAWRWTDMLAPRAAAPDEDARR